MSNTTKVSSRASRKMESKAKKNTDYMKNKEGLTTEDQNALTELIKCLDGSMEEEDFTEAVRKQKAIIGKQFLMRVCYSLQKGDVVSDVKPSDKLDEISRKLFAINNLSKKLQDIYKSVSITQNIISRSNLLQNKSPRSCDVIIEYNPISNNKIVVSIGKEVFLNQTAEDQDNKVRISISEPVTNSNQVYTDEGMSTSLLNPNPNHIDNSSILSSIPQSTTPTADISMTELSNLNQSSSERTNTCALKEELETLKEELKTTKRSRDEFEMRCTESEKNLKKLKVQLASEIACKNKIITTFTRVTQILKLAREEIVIPNEDSKMLISFKESTIHINKEQEDKLCMCNQIGVGVKMLMKWFGVEKITNSEFLILVENVKLFGLKEWNINSKTWSNFKQNHPGSVAEHDTASATTDDN